MPQGFLFIASTINEHYSYEILESIAYKENKSIEHTNGSNHFEVEFISHLLATYHFCTLNDQQFQANQHVLKIFKI